MRYAIYFTPGPNHPLTAMAASWLGRDAFTGAEQAIPEDRIAWVLSPRRYGFHATLKAPFRLAEGHTEDELLASFTAFCERRSSFVIPSITLSKIGPFFALTERGPVPELQAMGDGIVRHFESFRAPLSSTDIERRKPETLAPEERANLMLWGYPYVFETFRFHMTLTDTINDREAERVENELREHFASQIDQPLSVDGLAIFVEREPGTDFSILAYQPLTGTESS